MEIVGHDPAGALQGDESVGAAGDPGPEHAHARVERADVVIEREVRGHGVRGAVLEVDDRDRARGIVGMVGARLALVRNEELPVEGRDLGAALVEGVGRPDADRHELDTHDRRDLGRFAFAKLGWNIRLVQIPVASRTE